jgi:teichuronic acid biosynthesis glycosyltransferase TuaC
MKVLIVCSGNPRSGNFDFRINQSFIYEQIEAIKRNFSVDYDVFLVKGSGVKGYLRNLPALRQKAKKGKYHLIHAHYGTSGLLAVLQRRLPVVVTYHGSDIDIARERRFSRLAMRLATYNIFVTKRLADKSGAKKRFDVVSCGVDFEKIFPLNRLECRKKLGLEPTAKYALFSASFDNPVKNHPLALEAIKKAGDIELLELKGYTREEVNLLMNACDLVLVTSWHESGPLVVKEAIACGCPVVTTDVGDVQEVIGNLAGCFITSFDADEIAAKISLAAEFGRTEGQRQIAHLDNRLLAAKVFAIYQKVLTG